MKIRFLTLSCIALLMSAVLFSVTSCDDDDLAPGEPIEEYLESGITAEQTGGFSTFSVNASSAWSASIPEDCDWVTVMSECGTSKESLVIFFEDNFTRSERSTTLSITIDNTTTQVPLKQKASNGMLTSSSDNTSYLLTVAGNQHLGCGVNAAEFYNDPSNVELKYYTNRIFGFTALSNLMDQDVAMVSKRSKITYEDVKVDTIVNKTDTLSIKMTVNISYALFKFGINGAYKGNEDYAGNTMRLNLAVNYPALDTDLEYYNILSLYEDWVDDGSPADDYRGTVLTSGFVRARKKLNEAIEKNDASAIQTQIKNIIRSYGTGVIVSNELGGLAALSMDFDSTYIREDMSISGEVSTSITAGLFHLDADIAAQYASSAATHLNHTSHAIELRGGEGSKQAAVIAMFENSNFSTATNTAIQDWVSSITLGSSSAESNAEVLTIDIVPIWQLFEDDAREAIIEYMEAQYGGTPFMDEMSKYL